MKQYNVVLSSDQIKSQFKDALVYQGIGIEQEENKEIVIQIDDQKIKIDLNNVITNKQWLNSLDVADIKNICGLCNAEITFFPSGSSFAKSKFIFPLHVRSLYFAWQTIGQKDMLVSIAYDEVQPALYLGYLNSVIEVVRI